MTASDNSQKITSSNLHIYSQQQQSQQASQQPQPTNWLRVAIITAIVGGVVQVIVNHFDSMVANIVLIFSNFHIRGSGSKRTKTNV